MVFKYRHRSKTIRPRAASHFCEPAEDSPSLGGEGRGEGGRIYFRRQGSWVQCVKNFRGVFSTNLWRGQPLKPPSAPKSAEPFPFSPGEKAGMRADVFLPIGTRIPLSLNLAGSWFASSSNRNRQLPMNHALDNHNNRRKHPRLSYHSPSPGGEGRGEGGPVAPKRSVGGRIPSPQGLNFFNP
jgi:hypothetical protein